MLFVLNTHNKNNKTNWVQIPKTSVFTRSASALDGFHTSFLTEYQWTLITPSSSNAVTHRGLLHIIRFQDFFPHSLTCKSPLCLKGVFMWQRAQSLPNCTHNKKKKKKRQPRMTFIPGGNQCAMATMTLYIPDTEMCRANYYTGTCWCSTSAGHFSGFQHNRWHSIIINAVKPNLTAHCKKKKKKKRLSSDQGTSLLLSSTWSGPRSPQQSS